MAMIHVARDGAKLGEFTLEQMLSDLLPAETYRCQSPIAGGRADAIIQTMHGALCVDSKFPLDNFRRALQAADAVSRESCLKAFAADVRHRVDETPEPVVHADERVDEERRRHLGRRHPLRPQGAREART